jgi:hypothetical protein
MSSTAKELESSLWLAYGGYFSANLPRLPTKRTSVCKDPFVTSGKKGVAFQAKTRW